MLNLLMLKVALTKINIFMQKSCESIPLIQAHFRETDNALDNIYSMFSSQQKKNQNPCVLFLILTGSSKNSQQLSFIGERIRKTGKLSLLMCLMFVKSKTFLKFFCLFCVLHCFCCILFSMLNNIRCLNLALTKYIGKIYLDLSK